MAEGKNALFAKSLKFSRRTKEKLLQNLGKVDRTADEIFDEHINNYNRQQNNANKLQKEFNNYIRCIRAAQAASKTLMEAICEVYESHWSGAEALSAHAANVDVLWQDYSHKLGDQVMIPLNTYTGQFPEMRKKIDKRNRKLIDYDGQRHSFQNVQANAAKRKDDVKITKGRDQLEEARRTYELLNSELHDELPALHDSRILFLVTNLQTLFATEQLFHNETSKVYDELEAIVDKLATDSQRGSYTLKKSVNNTNSNPSSPPQSPIKSMNNSIAPVISSYPTTNITNGNSNNADNSPSSLASSPSPVERSLEHEHTTTTSVTTPTSLSSSQTEQNGDVNNIHNQLECEPSYQNTADIFSTTTTTSSSIPSSTTTTSKTIQSSNIDETTINKLQDDDLNNTNANTTQSSSLVTSSTTTTINNTIVTNQLNKTNNDNRVSTTIENINGNLNNKTEIKSLSPVGGIKGLKVGGGGGGIEIEVGGGLDNNNRMEQLYDIPVGATTTDLPPGVLYRVKATYRYIKEDADELSFEVGETIKVIEYDDPEDQEEGWLMGMKENSTEKGLFPANFTRPL